METRQPVNRTLYHSDNLPILQGINSETIDLIATDPPFNKNQDFHATPKSAAEGGKFSDRWSWDKDVHQEWVDDIKDGWPAVWANIESARRTAGEDMAAFLCWLGVRLMECHRILKPTGSLYLHMDSTANAYVKCLLDGIFERDNFRNEIIWRRHTSGHGSFQHAPKQWGTITDTILFYAKSKETPITPYATLSTEEADAKFPHIDENGRRYHSNKPIMNGPSMGARPNQCYEWNGYTNPHPSGWRLTKPRLEEEYQKGNIVILEDGRLKRRQYQDEFRGTPIGNLWQDINPAQGKEKTGYPTQKPLALYERIIKASSNEGDMVLDPFCGCATTPVAAERLGRQWIGIDMWEGAYDLVVKRLNDNRQLLVDIPPEVTKLTTPPERTDYSETPSAPNLQLKVQRAPVPWEKLSRDEMARLLAKAQSAMDGVICAGCGRAMEVEFMELDHITPKAEGGANSILNRILLCSKCNGRKRNYLTLAGLMAENKKPGVKWMRDEQRAKLARDKAQQRAEWVRDNYGSQEYKDEINALN